MSRTMMRETKTYGSIKGEEAGPSFEEELEGVNEPSSILYNLRSLAL